MMKWTILVAALLPTTEAFVPAATQRTHVQSTALNAESSRRSVLANIAAFAPIVAGAASANAIETYLTEPTEEFKESERQRMEFRKKQLELKAEFVKVLARLTTESSTEAQLVEDLTDLKTLVIITGGLPLGIKKEEMYKVIRSKKAKGFWPTDVEIAYQKLKSEIAYQQSPNTEKDLENPL